MRKKKYSEFYLDESPKLIEALQKDSLADATVKISAIRTKHAIHTADILVYDSRSSAQYSLIHFCAKIGDVDKVTAFVSTFDLSKNIGRKSFISGQKTNIFCDLLTNFSLITSTLHSHSLVKTAPFNTQPTNNMLASRDLNTIRCLETLRANGIKDEKLFEHVFASTTTIIDLLLNNLILKSSDMDEAMEKLIGWIQPAIAKDPTCLLLFRDEIVQKTVCEASDSALAKQIVARLEKDIKKDKANDNELTK